jgi:hypothetical protein
LEEEEEALEPVSLSKRPVKEVVLLLRSLLGLSVSLVGEQPIEEQGDPGMGESNSSCPSEPASFARAVTIRRSRLETPRS